MIADEEGRRVLEEQPRTTALVSEDLLALPANTLGHRYALFMQENKFSFTDRPLTKNIHDYELAYVKQRYKEIHDIFHVLLGLTHINVLNELKVKYFELINLGLPVF